MQEVLKGLDILYTGGSEITISHALQMDEHEKEQTLFDNTLDDELSDSTEPSLSEMSPSCLNEEMDNISSSLHSSISITVPESAESETEMNVTKTEERGTQPCSPKKPVGLEDTGYLDFPSKCFSDGEATLSHLKYITGISLTDDYIDTSLCTEVH